MNLWLIIGIPVGLLALWALGFYALCMKMAQFFMYPDRPKRQLAESWYTGHESLGTPQTVDLVAADGRTPLRGIWYPHPASTTGATLVLCHGVTSYKEECLTLAHVAHDLGYSTFLIDFRGHGESGGRYSTLGLEEVDDLRAVVDWVALQQGVNPARIGLLGHSMGAVTILRYLAEYDIPIPFAIIMAPFASLDRALFQRLSVMRVPFRPARRLMLGFTQRAIQRDIFENVPLNIVDSIRETALCYAHGLRDRGNHPNDSRDLHAATRVEKELHWIPDAGHHALLQDIHMATVVRDYAGRWMERFVAEDLAEPSRDPEDRARAVGDEESAGDPVDERMGRELDQPLTHR
ncbi:MAG: alpha/beta fold hydrolase [bacterium]